jgi:hypothetical protein
MKNNDFLKGVFEILELSEDSQKKTKEVFVEILRIELTIAFINKLPPEKKEDFLLLLNNKETTLKTMEFWFKENGVFLDEDLSKKFDNIFEESVRKFFSALIKDLDQEKKQKLIKYTEGNLI